MTMDYFILKKPVTQSAKRTTRDTSSDNFFKEAFGTNIKTCGLTSELKNSKQQSILIWSIICTKNQEFTLNIIKQLFIERKERHFSRKDALGRTALMWSVIRGKQVIVDFLLFQPFALNEQDNDGKTALMHAIENGYVNIVKRLTKERKINVYLTDKHNATAFNYALARGDEEIIQLVGNKYKEFKENFISNFRKNIRRRISE